MEDARKMMDSLMGQFRDVPLKEAKKRKGQNFKESNVCKAYLIGFCLQHEEIFKNTKKGSLQLGNCDKVHSDALIDEFEASPDKSDYERTYTRDLLKYLESFTRKVDDEVRKKAGNLQDKNQEIEDKGPNAIAKAQIDIVRQSCSALLAEAEELAENGDIAGSKLKTTLYEETKARAEEYDQKAREPVKEDICPICGLRNEDQEGVVMFTHAEGRIHLGFVKIREWIIKLKERLDKLEDERGKKQDEGKSKDSSDGAAAAAATPGDGDKPNDREGDRDRRDRGEDRGSDRRREDRGDGDSDRRREDRGGNERRGSDRDNRDGGSRGHDRRGDRGRDNERGYDNGHGRGRSRSGGRRR